MGLICLSYSHLHTSIAFREKIHFDRNAVANACARFRCGDDPANPFLELAVLSTCNRTEIYAYCSDSTAGETTTATDQFQAVGEPLPNEPSVDSICADSFLMLNDRNVEIQKQLLLRFVAEARGMTVAELQQQARWYHGPTVQGHLARVAAGLESIVLGEPQILGQVGDAMRMGLVMNSAGPIISKLFQTAIGVGRRARTETEIGVHSSNIATLAVNTAEKQLGSLQDKTVVLLGAGDMADLALAQLVKKGVQEIKIVNRTIAKAKQLADQYQGSAYVFEQIADVMLHADILISSTGAPHTLVTLEMVAMAMRERPDRQLSILDIAVPRDVDERVDHIPNVQRCDMDDLQIAAGQSVQSRELAIPKVEQIIEQEVDRFVAWFRSVGIEQTVAALRRKTEQIRESEWSRLMSLLPHLDPQTAQVIERFSQSLTNKLLHDPTVKLRQLEGSRSAVDHGEAIRELFGLTEDVAQPTRAEAKRG